ncbi:MAG: hypothetical protein HY659_06915 [Rhizobiales bacterium]|nr:hypothetical protein [Hyphomicrobiales bacterium]
MDDVQDQAGIFEAVRLAQRESDRVYPLVRLFHPSLSLDQWQQFVNACMRGSSGVMVVRDTRDCIHAAFVYTIDARLARGPLLRITELMVGRLPGSLVNQAIMDAVEHLARSTGAEAIEISVPSALEYAVDPTWRGALIAAGFSARTTSMMRRLAPPPAAESIRYDIRR